MNLHTNIPSFVLSALVLALTPFSGLLGLWFGPFRLILGFVIILVIFFIIIIDIFKLHTWFFDDSRHSFYIPYLHFVLDGLFEGEVSGKYNDLVSQIPSLQK